MAVWLEGKKGKRVSEFNFGRVRVGGVMGLGFPLM